MIKHHYFTNIGSNYIAKDRFLHDDDNSMMAMLLMIMMKMTKMMMMMLTMTLAVTGTEIIRISLITFRKVVKVTRLLLGRLRILWVFCFINMNAFE